MNASTPDAVFRDRAAAGRRLAARLERLRREAPVVLGIPPGGVLVAAEVAAALGAPLDVLAVRRLGEPGARLGAVAEGGLAIVHHGQARAAGLDAEAVARLRRQAEDAADGDAERLRGWRRPYDLVGRTALLVDDGIGSGDTAVAAARTARRRGAARTVLAAPVASAGALSRLRTEVDEVVCLQTASAARPYADDERPGERAVLAALGRPRADERLSVPEGARGAVVAAGAGDLVLQRLRDKAFAVLTLPADAPVEAVAAGIHRLQTQPATAHLAIGVLGLGPAVEAALTAAAAADVRAVVAAGGRPDRAEAGQAATLLIVGGEDRHLLALARASGLQVAVVAGAGHDFHEPGALEQVAHLASGWLAQRLREPSGTAQARSRQS